MMMIMRKVLKLSLKVIIGITHAPNRSKFCGKQFVLRACI